MKNAIRLLIATLTLATASFAGVTVSSPATGSAAGSPVHFVASATSTHPITAMRIYVDNLSVYLVSASSLNTSVTMSAGTHSVVDSSLGLDWSGLQNTVKPDRKRQHADSHSNASSDSNSSTGPARASFNRGSEKQYPTDAKLG